jgi:hypothetical protein
MSEGKFQPRLDSRGRSHHQFDFCGDRYAQLTSTLSARGERDVRFCLRSS